MKTDTPTLIRALRILAQDIQSGDGVANAAIAEAADRLEELSGYEIGTIGTLMLSDGTLMAVRIKGLAEMPKDPV
jgi:hypothetical protein